jgi:hypothetical protein
MFRKLITYGEDLKMKIERTAEAMKRLHNITPTEMLRRVLTAGFNNPEFRKHWDKNDEPKNS